jgi:hypothetical protein
VIRTLWWPSRTDTLSIGTPARSNSTANVSRNRWACPSCIFASLNSLRKRVCQLRTMLSSFPLPLQKKNFSVTLGVAASADTTKSGRTVFTGTPVFIEKRGCLLGVRYSNSPHLQFAYRCIEAIALSLECAYRSQLHDLAFHFCTGLWRQEFDAPLRY